MSEDEKLILENLRKEFGDLELEELLEILKTEKENLKLENKYLKTKKDLLVARDNEMHDDEELTFNEFKIRVIDKDE